MAENEPQTKPQRLVSSATGPIKKNPRKFYNHFLFKALIATIFIVIIPVFPSEPPNFVTPTIFTKSWELLHIIFVGIAVSYGLFSRKNDESEGESTGKFDNTTQSYSYISRLFQVNSVFDDGSEIPTVCNDGDGDDGDGDDNGENGEKVQTWRSRYVRNEPPMIVVAEENDGKNCGIDGEKPLLLPVRSLKSRICDDKFEDFDFGGSRVYTRSNTGPIEKGFKKNLKSLSGNDLIGFVHGEDFRVCSSAKEREFSSDRKGICRNGSVDDGGGGVEEEHGEKVEESVVLPSPIPWRSRSGRMEMRGELDEPDVHLLPLSLQESEPARLLKPRLLSVSSSSPPPSPNVNVPSSRKASSTLESHGKSVQDLGRSRKSNYNSGLPPPPPPPPPPPRFLRSTNRSRQVRSYSSSDDEPRSNNNEGLEEVNMSLSVRTNRPKEVTNASGSYSEYPKETRDFLQQVLLETDDESESEGENHREEMMETSTKVGEGCSETVNDDGPDVDKKADEFIAKFREQIRLQRIESIKKSTGQLNRRTSAR